jgi:ketosteroid isomerase-like protein
MLRCGFLSAFALFCASASGQTPSSLSADDTREIQALSASYLQALGACKAEDYADLFAADTGFFASGFRGRIVGRERLIKLVESERHCIAPPDSPQSRRPGGNGPAVVLEVTSTGVRGVADLGRAGQYQDEYTKTPQGWKIASRTVLTPAEIAVGLAPGDMHAIQRIAAPDLVDHHVPDQNGVARLLNSGVAISVADGAVTGHAYVADGGYNDDVYEKTGSGQWRIKSRSYVPPAAP